MQITLSSNEIKKAVLASLGKTLNIEGKDVAITFTSGRSRNDLTASVVITDKDEVLISGGNDDVPPFNDDVDPALKLVEQPEQAVAEQTLGDPVQAAEAHTPASTGLLFNRNTSAQ